MLIAAYARKVCIVFSDGDVKNLVAVGGIDLYEARFWYIWLGFERIVEVDGAVG